MRILTMIKCDDGSIWVTSNEDLNGSESKFKVIEDEKQQFLIALCDFLGYDPYYLMGHAFAGEPGWE